MNLVGLNLDHSVYQKLYLEYFLLTNNDLLTKHCQSLHHFYNVYNYSKLSFNIRHFTKFQIGFVMCNSIASSVSSFVLLILN